MDLMRTGEMLSSSKEQLNLKMQIKKIKNLNLKEKLHYQRLIKHNTQNKNFNLTHHNKAISFREMSKQAMNTTALPSVRDELSHRGPKKGKKHFLKDKLSQMRKLSEQKDESIDPHHKIGGFNNERNSDYGQVPFDQKMNEKMNVTGPDFDDRTMHDTNFEMQRCGFNRT